MAWILAVFLVNGPFCGDAGEQRIAREQTEKGKQKTGDSHDYLVDFEHMQVEGKWAQMSWLRTDFLILSSS